MVGLRRRFVNCLRAPAMGASLAKVLNRFSARLVSNLRTPGRHADGGGLYAAIAKDGGSRRWVFLFRWQGGRIEMGLGSLEDVPLARARELAARCRLDIAEGRNPLEIRRAGQAVERLAQTASSRQKTFGEVADALIATKSPGWRNEKHRAQWEMTLKVYASPLRPRPVAEITTDEVVAVLQPIWAEKPETASRVRGRIEAVLDAAKARGLIPTHAANPARWRGHLDHLLPPRGLLSRGHHAALPWKRLPNFMRSLRLRTGTAPLALEWCILTAARLGEALGTRWCEINFDEAIWECPAERMKAHKAHRVPLSPPALALLRSLPRGEPGAFVFPGARPGKPLSNMVMKSLFNRMGEHKITSHGFRSTFRDWAGESTQFPREICEAALAHAVGNAVELAYRRGDALEKRRALMIAWGEYCAGVSRPDLTFLGSIETQNGEAVA
jgi:integrase